MRRYLLYDEYVRQPPNKAEFNAPVRPQVIFYNGAEFIFYNITD